LPSPVFFNTCHGLAIIPSRSLTEQEEFGHNFRIPGTRSRVMHCIATGHQTMSRVHKSLAQAWMGYSFANCHRSLACTSTRDMVCLRKAIWPANLSMIGYLGQLGVVNSAAHPTSLHRSTSSMCPISPLLIKPNDSTHHTPNNVFVTVSVYVFCNAYMNST
jgi:hypothetical protein